LGFDWVENPEGENPATLSLPINEIVHSLYIGKCIIWKNLSLIARREMWSYRDKKKCQVKIRSLGDISRKGNFSSHRKTPTEYWKTLV
jgi:hypothetical protein